METEQSATLLQQAIFWRLNGSKGGSSPPHDHYWTDEDLDIWEDENLENWEVG